MQSSSKAEPAIYPRWLVLFLVLALTGLTTACTPSTAKAKNLGSLEEISYEYGSFHSGYWSYELKKSVPGPAPTDQTQISFQAQGMNGVDMDIDTIVESSVLADLEDIIMQHNIISWNGFKESDSDILDGFDFSLKARFSNGSIIASGYMLYPPNWDQGHQALSEYLQELANAHS